MYHCEAIRSGFPPEIRHLPAASQFWQYCDALHVSDGVIIYKDRVVVPLPSTYVRELAFNNCFRQY